MEVTFGLLLERMERDQQPSPLMDSGEETRAMSAIRSGNDLRTNDDDPSFWDDFINLCANADGMSQLLGVPVEKIQSWPDKIKEQLQNVQSHDAQSPAVKDDVNMMPTGDTGAVTMNSDPDLGVS